MASKKNNSKVDSSIDPNKTANSNSSFHVPDPEGYNTENYQCLRDKDDGSMYYGEVGYMTRDSGKVIKHGSEAYTNQIKALTEE